MTRTALKGLLANSPINDILKTTYEVIRDMFERQVRHIHALSSFKDSKLSFRESKSYQFLWFLWSWATYTSYHGIVEDVQLKYEENKNQAWLTLSSASQHQREVRMEF